MANCGLTLNDATFFFELNSGGVLLLNDNSCILEPGQEALGGGGAQPHRGSIYWKRYQEELKLKKKKKTKKELLLEELDEQLIELNARIDETPIENVVPAWVADLRRVEDFAYNELVTEHSSQEISAYLTILLEITREMDDEEIIMLAIH